VKGERRLRPRFAIVVPGGLGSASRRTMTPRARSLPLPRRSGEAAKSGALGKRGPQVEKDAAVERRKARPVRQDRSRAPCKGTVSLRRTALCSLSFVGGNRNTNQTRAGPSRRENEDACQFKTGLFDNLIGKGCDAGLPSPLRLILRSGEAASRPPTRYRASARLPAPP